ncbi:hypothetical protein E6H36_03360 [Candidatus Bathyarchaeota archaeon]|nr:MAG: hypothetical protein E6H36_03360 [Candidatus Bathyarchaeota archaeon]TMI31788.1 MAG: hypothetical protein E6H29_03500 [Candidatus Bathyarchaeota archaeon]
MNPRAETQTANKDLETTEIVRKARENASRMLRDAGYDIGNNVDAVIDPKLPFMGYTAPQRGGFKIVVSGGSVESGLLEGLLVHEMSHVYRIRTQHPSHNGTILQEAVGNLGKMRPYQEKILFDLLNDIQDLYADDISFQVIRKNKIMNDSQATDFLQSWVKDKPAKTDDVKKDNWTNASIMEHNARALAQMHRHGVKDVDNRAKLANQKFLASIPPKMAEHYPYFENLLTNLRQDLTEDNYGTLLADVLKHFLEAANINRLK